jgi:antitoxin component of MazEF toxin-antitoxin module
MRATLTAVGQDAFLPLPDDLMKRLGLAEGASIEVVEQPDGSLLVTAAKPVHDLP